MRKLLIASLLLLPMLAKAQYTQRISTPATFNTRDSSALKVKAHAKPTMDFELYSDAYDRYVRRELFKQRNKIKIKSSLRISQASYDNWANAGSNNFSFRAYAYVEHLYSKNSFNVRSKFEGAYTFNITNEYSRKTEDWFFIESVPSWKIADRLEISGSATLRSQFANSFQAPGDTTLVSSFLAPGNFNLALGMTYRQPNSRFVFFFGPISGSMQMLLNKELSDKGGFGLDKGQQFKADLGMKASMEYGIKFCKNIIDFNTKAESYWSFKQTIPSLWWETKLYFQLTNLLSAEFYMQVKYNSQDRTPRADENNYWQFNQSFGFGISYNVDFKNNPGPKKIKITKTRVKTN